MVKFADEVTIKVSSGKGGNGCIAFRREKYVPLGGPSGGDGGRGGDVVFQVKKNLRTLAHMRYKQHFKARNGSDGEGGNRFGKDGEDVILPVPPGTIIKDAMTGEVICQFTTESEDEVFTFLHGGNGGWGNVHFKSSTNQAPRHANQGLEGESRELLVELNIMADIGLVGFPNAGKSSLLDYFTNARPKIAPYPFTTKIPNLGVLRVDQENDIIIADIPGILEGASEGLGLGTRFLKHISRTQGLVFIIDLADDNYIEAFDILLQELKNFSTKLFNKKRIILCNKLDLEGTKDRLKEIQKKYPAETILGMSLYNRRGLEDVKKQIIVLSNFIHAANENSNEAKQSSFLQDRSVCETEEIHYPGQDFS
ncbi:MAG: GTPase ObgE [Treponemataceae bacterium]